MKKHFFLFLLIAGGFISCNETNDAGNRDKYLPSSSGTHAELLIVTQDTFWQSYVGEMLLATFAREQYGLPQPEGVFSVNRIKPAAFTSIFKRAKSIVLVEKGDSTAIRIQKNVWAKPQLVATLIAPTHKALYALIKKHEADLVEVFHTADISIVKNRLKGTAYTTLPPALSEMGIKEMTFSSGFEQTLDKTEIKIFRQSTKKTQQFMVFSKRPIPEDLLPGQDILPARDSIGKQYFEGTSEGSYFGTEMMIPPQQQNTEIDGQFAIETRGLWKTFGDFMGGPFLSYTIYNDAKDEILCVEGFIYGPDAKKRNIIMEMEAMMRSIVLE